MTNKFKFKLKITGLELEVEGSKDEVATITSNFGNQLRGLSQSQILNVSGDEVDTNVPEIIYKLMSKKGKKYGEPELLQMGQ